LDIYLLLRSFLRQWWFAVILRAMSCLFRY